VRTLSLRSKVSCDKYVIESLRCITKQMHLLNSLTVLKLRSNQSVRRLVIQKYPYKSKPYQTSLAMEILLNRYFI